MHTGIERPSSCNIAQRISGFHYCTNPLIKASSSRPLLPRPNPQSPWRPWDSWLIDELAVQPFLQRSQDISAKTKMPPRHHMVPCLQVALKIYLQFLPRVTNVCCLLLSGCCDPSPFLSEAKNSSARRYFWKLKRTFLQFGNKKQHSPLGPSHRWYQSGQIFEKYLCLGFSGIQQ